MTGADFQEFAAETLNGRTVSLRFPPEEHARRLAALLVFAQESHYYLTGYDTAGYVFFQAGVIMADERPTVLLARRPDQRQAEVASLYDDIRIWLNAEDAFKLVKDAARPGAALGTLDDIHRHVLDGAGFGSERYAACGYALGCTFRPTWMDVPTMIYSGNSLSMEPGMVFFVHIMIPDTRTGIMAGIGQTFAIRETGPPEVFSALRTELLTR